VGQSGLLWDNVNRSFILHYNFLNTLHVAEHINPHVRTPILKSKNRILLVDNESDITLTFEEVLKDEGLIIDSFNDPHLALSNFGAGIYDIALIDIKMPQMNGFDLYRKLKDIDDNVQYCFMTAYELYYEELKKNYPGLDVGWFIRKPISVEQLVRQIKSKLY
jgi:two-component system response regulator ChvI